MCGIAGVIGKKQQNNEEIIGLMTKKIIHRGPDDDGFYVDNNVGLGMRRLSIIDLNTGRQPITSFDDRYLIFFNGEIYNYKELKDELLKEKIKFKTNSDTEVVLQMYIKYGHESLNKLRGMFAFCIYDTENKKIFLARDYFGIKPLYYLTVNNSIRGFASEIKSFFAVPDFVPEVNDSAIYNYLSFQYNPLAETMFKNVYKLPPGHYMSIDTENDEVLIQKYWQYEFKQNYSLDEGLTKQKIFEIVKDSVEHHMIADVPVGAFLSGGIDSSIITTLMQDVRGEDKIKTFTVGWDKLTEALEAEDTAKFLGTDHTELKISKDEYFANLAKAVYHFDEPIADPSAIGLYFVAQEASKHVKVVLSGEGSDELFGGYNIYLTPFQSQKLKFIPKFVLNFLTSLPFNYFGKNYLTRVNSKLEDWYIGQKYFNGSIYTRQEISRLWLGSPQKFMSLNSLFKQGLGLSDSSKMQLIDINTWLVGDILAKADKMTMANSLELRVPFLDIEVANLSLTLPDKFKWKTGITKYLLREAFKGVIPETTRNRRKLGFPTPIKEWMDEKSDDIYNLILDNDYIKSKMNLDYIKDIIEKHKTKTEENSRKIYTLLMLALWYDVFITNKINPSISLNIHD